MVEAGTVGGEGASASLEEHGQRHAKREPLHSLPTVDRANDKQ